jgi:hypothetical protein
MCTIRRTHTACIRRTKQRCRPEHFPRARRVGRPGIVCHLNQNTSVYRSESKCMQKLGAVKLCKRLYLDRLCGCSTRKRSYEALHRSYHSRRVAYDLIAYPIGKEQPELPPPWSHVAPRLCKTDRERAVSPAPIPYPHGQLTLEHRFSSLTLRLSRTVFTSGIERGD